MSLPVCRPVCIVRNALSISAMQNVLWGSDIFSSPAPTSLSTSFSAGIIIAGLSSTIMSKSATTNEMFF